MTIVQDGKVVYESESAKQARQRTAKEIAAANTDAIKANRAESELKNRPVHSGLVAVVVAKARLAKPLSKADWQAIDAKIEQRRAVRAIALENAPSKVKEAYVSQFREMAARINAGDKSVSGDYALSKEEFISSKNEILHTAKAQIRKIDAELGDYWHKCVRAAQIAAAELHAVRETEERGDCERYGWPFHPSPILQALEKIARKPELSLNYSESALLAFKA